MPLPRGTRPGGEHLFGGAREPLLTRWDGQGAEGACRLRGGLLRAADRQPRGVGLRAVHGRQPVRDLLIGAEHRTEQLGDLLLVHGHRARSRGGVLRPRLQILILP
jgi:hypothetical protein